MTSRRLVLLLALAACGDRTPIPAEDRLLRITVDSDEVVLGRAFSLEAVRVWGKQDPPEPWSDASLAPLAVRDEAVSRREDESRVEETRRYKAYAFSLEDVTVGGNTLNVKRALDPNAPGPAELPAPLERGFPWAWLGLAALAVGVFLYRRTTVTVQPAPPPPPPTSERGPDAIALERIARLRAAGLDVQPFYVEATALLREYIGARYDIPALKMTTEEVVGAAPAPLKTLQHCDLVKFARGAPELDKTLDEVERFVRDTA